MTPEGHSPAPAKSWRGVRAGAILLAAAVWAASAAYAEPASAQSGAAEALFRQAVGLAKKGKYAAAIPKFEASYELDPARGTLLGWAMAEERAGKLANALAHYQQLRDEARSAGDERREELAKKRIAQLLPRVPMLTITAAEPLPEDIKITLNGRRLPAGALGSRLPLDPGAYQLRAEAPDGAHFAGDFSLAPGARESVVIELVPGAPPEPPDQPEPPVQPAQPIQPDPPPPVLEEEGGWTALQTTGVLFGVVGLGGLGVGSYLWFDSGRQFDEVSAACGDNNVCPESQRTAIEDGSSQENLARVALLLGGVAFTAGVTLVVFGGGGGSAEQATLSLSVAPSRVGVRGRF